MKIEVEQFDSGWFDLSLRLSQKEVKKLMSMLKALEAKKLGHFHFVSTDSSENLGVFDIEFSLKGDEEGDNMCIS